jgi:transposase
VVAVQVTMVDLRASALPKTPLSVSFPGAGNHMPHWFTDRASFTEAAGQTSPPPSRNRGELVPLPSLSPEQRAAALEKAAEIRKARAELKEQLKQGKTTLAAVLDRAENDDVVGKLKVSAVLQAMPGIGKIRAMQIMEKLKIADSRRLRGLGEQQRKALLGEFAAN